MSRKLMRGCKDRSIAHCVAATVERLERRTFLSGVSGTSPGFNVTDRLVFTTQPPHMVAAGVRFDVKVSAEDGAGTLDTAFNGPVTLSDQYWTDYYSPLDGALTVKAVNGIATFTGLTQEYATADASNNQYDVLYADSGKLPTGVSSAFAIFQDRLVFLTVPPATMTAGAPFDVRIEALTPLGDLDANFKGIVVLSDHYSSNGAPLNGRTTVRAVDGIATFTGITQDTATEGSFGAQFGADILYAYGYDAGMPNAGSHGFRINAAPATQLVLSGTPVDTSGDGLTLVNAPLSVQVFAEDPFGNIDPTFTGKITLAPECQHRQRQSRWHDRDGGVKGRGEFHQPHGRRDRRWICPTRVRPRDGGHGPI